MNSRLHTDAVLALLVTAGWVAGVTLFDADVVGSIGGRYTALWPSPGMREAIDLSAQPGQFTVSFQTTHVGGDRNESQYEADAAAAVLAGARPVVAGYACSPIEQVGNGGPVTVDADSRTSGDRRGWVSVVLYEFTSYPA